MWALWMVGCGLLPADAPPEVPLPSPAAPAAPEVPPGVDPTEPRYAATHVLVAWQGAVGAPSGVTRTEAEAEALARELHARARAEPLESLARSHSDDASGRRGGRLGVWLTGTMVPDFERVVASVDPGELAPLVRTPFGWHVVRRDPIEEVEVAHIQVSFQGALRADTPRTREEALAAIQAIEARVRAGEDFGALAAELSDDASRDARGQLGIVARGQMMPAFEDAAFALKPGETSAIVETPYGFHLVRRTR